MSRSPDERQQKDSEQESASKLQKLVTFTHKKTGVDISNKVQFLKNTSKKVTGRVGPKMMIFLLLCIGAIYWMRPWFQWIALLMWTNLWVIPSVIVSVGIGFALNYVGKYLFTRLGWSPLDADLRVTIRLFIIGLLVLSVFISGGVLASIWTDKVLSNKVMSDAERMQNPYQNDADNARILTRHVADVQASNSFSNPMYYLSSESDIVVDNGSLEWSYAKIPSNIRNQYVLGQDGAKRVQISSFEARVTDVGNEMKIGQEDLFYQTTDWNIHKTEYLVYQGDEYTLHSHRTNTTYNVVPTVSFYHRLTWKYPFIHTVPKQNGVYLVEQNGQIHHKTLEEARKMPILQDQRLLVYELVRDKIVATNYKNGVINTLPIVGAHHEMLEMVNPPGKNNNQPYMMMVEDNRLMMVSTVEAYGSGGGLYQYWATDPQTGKYYYVTFDKSYVGPSSAAKYVKKQLPRVQWNNFEIAEPIPVWTGEQLYWSYRVVESNGGGVSYVVFVDPITEKVTTARTMAEVKDFYKDGEITRGTQTGNQTYVKRNLELVVRNDENNVVTTIPLRDGWSFDVNATNRTIMNKTSA